MKRTLIAVFVVLMTLMTVAVAPPSPVGSPVEWDGNQGTENDEVCDDAHFGDNGGIHWIATGYNATATNYTLTIYVDSVEVEVAYPDPTAGTTGNAIHFYTEYYDWTSVNLEAVLTFDGTMDSNAKVVISHHCSDDGDGGTQEIPEFPTVALPVAAIIGLAFFFQRRKE